MRTNTRNGVAQLQVKVAALVAAAIVAAAGSWSYPTLAQSFSSGSDGSDGALSLAANLGVIAFDPGDTARWGRVLDADGDGVFNFTTIAIGSGTTLKFSADKVNRPIYLLASGNVTIGGNLDLSGASGSFTTDLGVRRQLTVPGSGGFAGGAGGAANACSVPATPGDGPGGGKAAAPCDGNRRNGVGGTYSGNRYLLPLVGGSGGGGGLEVGQFYYPGGAGGGAILIASSTVIAVTGTVSAAGGASQNNGGPCAGPGSGGAIRLVAPTVSGSGHLNVNAGGAGCGVFGSQGMVRIEAFTISTDLIFDAGGAFATKGSPVDQGSLRPAGQVRVTAVGGVAVPPNPSGSFIVPDVTISNGSAVPVDIEAVGVPPGTVVTLQVFPQTPDDPTVVNLPAVQVTLNGTTAHSTASVNFTFPYGFSRGVIRASWTQ